MKENLMNLLYCLFYFGLFDFLYFCLSVFSSFCHNLFLITKFVSVLLESFGAFLGVKGQMFTVGMAWTSLPNL